MLFIYVVVNLWRLCWIISMLIGVALLIITIKHFSMLLSHIIIINNLFTTSTSTIIVIALLLLLWHLWPRMRPQHPLPLFLRTLRRHEHPTTLHTPKVIIITTLNILTQRWREALWWCHPLDVRWREELFW